MADTVLRVLMVEDDDSDHELLAAACRRLQVPCRIERHATGKLGWDALCAARDGGTLPGLVILDLDLPVISGFELLERIRGDEELGLLPVMMLTGSTILDDREHCAAADHYFIKPVVAEGWSVIAALVSAYATRAQPDTPGSGPVARRRPPQLLHIEDSPDDRLIFSLAFARSGLRGMLHQVESVREAFAFLGHQGSYHDAPTPDLIVLDLGLAGEDGRSLLDTLRRDERFRAIPIIILTGSESLEDIRHCRELLVLDYVLKPKSAQQLSEFIGTFRQWFQSSMHGVPLWPRRP
jgi:CheY-like chemotaxis protein